jgi:hypothetical protein
VNEFCQLSRGVLVVDDDDDGDDEVAVVSLDRRLLLELPLEEARRHPPTRTE